MDLPIWSSGIETVSTFTGVAPEANPTSQMVIPVGSGVANRIDSP
jgi:hypothetical protein